MAYLTKTDLKNIQQFLARVLPRGYNEEERLVALIEKIDKQLHKENTHGINGQAGTASTQTEKMRNTKVA
jgi:hypothetical protein